MTARRALRAVPKDEPPKPPLVSITPQRAMGHYPDSLDNATKWLAAAKWMQGQKGGSIWLLDQDAPVKWRGLPVEKQVANSAVQR